MKAVIKTIKVSNGYANLRFEGDDKEYSCKVESFKGIDLKNEGDEIEFEPKEWKDKEGKSKWFINPVKSIGNGASKFQSNPRKDALTLACQVAAAGKIEVGKIRELADDLLVWLQK